jgi:hypothetical protein
MQLRFMRAELRDVCRAAQVSIPIAGLSFGRVAAAVVDLMSWAHACRRRIIREARALLHAVHINCPRADARPHRGIHPQSFARADKEAHGWITHEAMHDAIAHAQHCTVDVVEFEAILKEIDPRDEGRFNLRLYAWAFTQLGTLDQRVNEKRQRVQLTAFCFAVWNIVGASQARSRSAQGLLTCVCCSGMIVFHFLEHWTWVESIYFCFETLLTIGLGDFVPRTFTACIARDISVASCLVTADAHRALQAARTAAASSSCSAASGWACWRRWCRRLMRCRLRRRMWRALRRRRARGSGTPWQRQTTVTAMRCFRSGWRSGAWRRRPRTPAAQMQRTLLRSTGASPRTRRTSRTRRIGRTRRRHRASASLTMRKLRCGWVMALRRRKSERRFLQRCKLREQTRLLRELSRRRRRRSLRLLRRRRRWLHPCAGQYCRRRCRYRLLSSSRCAR